MARIKDSGYVLVKLLISLIFISVISMAILNFHIRAGQQVYYKDLPSSQSILANDVFSRISYHLKLAGYANSNKCQPLEINKSERSDSLIVRYNDIDITFFVGSNSTESEGILYKSVNGSPREILRGVEKIRFARTSSDMVVIDLTLSNNRDKSGIVSRSFSTSVKLNNY